MINKKGQSDQLSLFKINLTVTVSMTMTRTDNEKPENHSYLVVFF